MPRAEAGMVTASAGNWSVVLSESWSNPTTQTLPLVPGTFSPFRLVDESNYNRFFSDAINVAKLDFQNEFEEYVEEVESGSALEKEEFEAYFNTIPDIEKPIFVAAMKERLAKRDKERVLDEIQKRQTAEKRASGLEQQIAALKEELSKAKAMSEKERRRRDVEERTLRNAGDAKHVAKRLRQAKKRLRKGKKRR